MRKLQVDHHQTKARYKHYINFKLVSIPSVTQLLSIPCKNASYKAFKFNTNHFHTRSEYSFAVESKL